MYLGLNTATVGGWVTNFAGMLYIGFQLGEDILHSQKDLLH